MKIRKLLSDEAEPRDLLLLADPSLVMVETYLATGECYVAEFEQEVIGVFVLDKVNNETVEIKNIAVLDMMQGRGIGKKLIGDAVQTAKKMGYKTIEIATGNSSIGQLALYQKCGFEIIDVNKDYFVENYTEEIFENGVQCRNRIRLSMDV